MGPRVYVETTIPSFFYEEWPEAAMVARREWTRAWWASAAGRDELVTSEAVIEELERGDFEARNDCFKLLTDLPLLRIDQAVMEIVDTYLRHHVMPQDPKGDALHLAVASYHRCGFLVTWNCHHLANPNKLSHVRRVNTMLGIQVLALVTPYELLGEYDGQD